MSILKKDVVIGGVYEAKVSNKLVPVRIDREIEFHRYRGMRTGWVATNVSTGRTIHIKSAAKLRHAIALPKPRPTIAEVQPESKGHPDGYSPATVKALAGLGLPTTREGLENAGLLVNKKPAATSPAQPVSPSKPKVSPKSQPKPKPATSDDITKIAEALAALEKLGVSLKPNTTNGKH